METKELVVQIENGGGLMQMSPLDWLQYFLPGAVPMQNNPRIFEAPKPGKDKEKVYYQLEALVGAYQECKDKGINPISGLYLIPSNSPNKRASHKIKYSEGLTKARSIPGFLGINSGLLVVKKDNEDVLIERPGSLPHPGDVIWGAWAEAYIAGLPRPIRWEIDKEQFWGTGDVWDKKGPWMLCKTCEDQLAKNKLGALGKLPEPQTTPAVLPEAEEDILVEAQPSTLNPTENQTPLAEEETPFEFLANTLYVGTLTALNARDGKRAGSVVIETEHGPLTAFFYSRPASLKADEVWSKLIGKPAGLIFTEKEAKGHDDVARIYRYVDTLDLADEARKPNNGAAGEVGPQEEGQA